MNQLSAQRCSADSSNETSEPCVGAQMKEQPVVSNIVTLNSIQNGCTLFDFTEDQKAKYKFELPTPDVSGVLLFTAIPDDTREIIWSSRIKQIRITIIGPCRVLLTCLTAEGTPQHKDYLADPLQILSGAPTTPFYVTTLPFPPPKSNDASHISLAQAGFPLVVSFHSVDHLNAFLGSFEHTLAMMNSSASHLDASDPATVTSYFQYYGKMSNQMNMLQDSIRTKTYYNAIMYNAKSFHKKRVMDVGGGSGILSFFSAQAGAASVYIIEASSSAALATTLADSNIKWDAFIKVIHSTVEKLNLTADLEGEKVDILVSEPIGTFIFNERMIESYLYARDMFLKPGGQMYPNRCRLFLAPFCDPLLYSDFSNRPAFWAEQNFYGIDLSSVYQKATDELFRQPVVDYIDPNNLINTEWHCEVFDLETLPREALTSITIKYRFPITSPCLIHGIAGWFDVHFDAGEHHVEFSTSPLSPPTHWYQIRFLFRVPIAVNPGQVVYGTLRMTANPQQSYYITADAAIEGTNIYTFTTVIDLKDPDYRYYTSPHNLYIPSVRQSSQTNNPSVRNDFNGKTTSREVFQDQSTASTTG